MVHRSIQIELVCMVSKANHLVSPATSANPYLLCAILSFSVILELLRDNIEPMNDDKHIVTKRGKPNMLANRKMKNAILDPNISPEVAVNLVIRASF